MSPEGTRFLKEEALGNFPEIVSASNLTYQIFCGQVCNGHLIEALSSRNCRCALDNVFDLDSLLFLIPLVCNCLDSLFIDSIHDFFLIKCLHYHLGIDI